MTENQQVLKHLKSHVGITQRYAADMYGIYRLSARIYDLRQEGHKIITMRREVPTSYEKTAIIAEYRLVEG